MHEIRSLHREMPADQLPSTLHFNVTKTDSSTSSASTGGGSSSAASADVSSTVGAGGTCILSTRKMEERKRWVACGLFNCLLPSSFWVLTLHVLVFFLTLLFLSTSHGSLQMLKLFSDSWLVLFCRLFSLTFFLTLVLISVLLQRNLATAKRDVGANEQ